MMNNNVKTNYTQENDSSMQKEIVLTQKGFEEVPSKLLEPGLFRSIITLDLSCNEINELPAALFANFTGLEVLNMQNNKLISLSKDVEKLKRLRVLRLDHNLLSTLPQAIGELTCLESLSVSKNTLLTLPMSIGNLSKSLKYLNFSGNAIKFLPMEIGALSGLRELFMDHNRFSTLPTTICKCALLQELSLDWLCYTTYSASHVKGETLQTILTALKRLCSVAEQDKRAEGGMMELIQEFSEDAFDINAQDFATGRSWLHMAARHNHMSVIETLIKEKVEVNVLDKERYSPMCLAIKHHNLDSAMIILEAGAEINYGGGPFGTALHMAVLKNELWLVKELIKRGANVNIADEETLNTPLHHLFASFDRFPYKAATVAETLLLAGANPNLKNLEGWAPIHIAAKKGQSKAIRWVLRNNPWIKERTKFGFELNLQGGSERWTALHLAGHAGHYKLVQMLISSGTDLFIRNTDLRTPRQASKGNLAIYKLFKRAESKAAKEKIGIALRGSMLEAIDELDSRTAKSVNSPLRTSALGIPHAETVFATEITKKGHRDISPSKNAEDSPMTFEPRISIIKISPQKPELPGSKLPFTKTINAYYLRDKILNNSARLHERFDALNTLKGGKSGTLTMKAFG